MRIIDVNSVGAAALSLLLAGAACGGGSGATSGTSGVGTSKRLIDLSAAEKGQLCDWMVGRAGSYAKAGSCGAQSDGFLDYADQAACIADSPKSTDTGCQATVADLEKCVSSLPACATLTQAASMPACAILQSC
jgi:hypothetical protein